MYAQNKEDQILWQYFEANPPKRGYKRFVDIGANDGKTLSNTHLFALEGWGGYCIEPDPRAFERLQKLYEKNTKIQCFPIALGDTNADVEFYLSGELLKQNDLGLVSTMVQAETNRFKKVVSYEKTTVKQVASGNFFADFPTTFALLSIDAEGMDYAILKEVPLLGVQAVCIEWNSVLAVMDKYNHFFEKRGFKKYHTNQENVIFVR